MKTRLTVVPPAPPAAEIEDMDDADARVWLRKMTDTGRQLCDAIDAYLGPEHPAPRPQLIVIPGGKE